MIQTHTINLNSPIGNVFNLIGTVTLLMEQLKFSDADIRAFSKSCMEQKTYDDIVEICKKYIDLINKVSVDQYEIISTEHYQMY